MDRAKAIDLVLKELDSAQKKWPPMHSAHEGYAVILEELDELWREVQRAQKIARIESPEAAQKLMADEAKQVAAMALRFLIDVC